MRINYFSDIHLEFGPLQPPTVNADIIIAAGDIGIYTQGIEWLKTLKKPVIYVAGNHEFYYQELRETIREFRDQCADSQVYFLENNKFIYQGVRFLGCTLWADLFVEGDEKAEKLAKTLNDFQKIRFGPESFGPQAFSQLYYRSKEWLERQLSTPFSGKTVVVTHHAPSQWSWDKSPNALKKLAYCNDLKPLLHQYDVAAWFHGHTHSISDYRVAGTRIFCNPRGYAEKKLVADFDINKIVTI
ncbi:MAG: metallophosphoesterase [Gammaproteobacteria bacterium]